MNTNQKALLITLIIALLLLNIILWLNNNAATKQTATPVASHQPAQAPTTNNSISAPITSKNSPPATEKEQPPSQQAINTPKPEKVNFGLNNLPITGLNQLFTSYGLQNIQKIDPTIQVELRYASTNNFLNTQIYSADTKAYLQEAMAIMLRTANELLREQKPNYRLLVLDAARPLRAQQALFQVAKQNGQSSYVASPKNHSVHNYGVAVDVTIINLNNNRLVDMGTPYDYFYKEAQPRYEKEMLNSGKLSQKQIDNRNLLRSVMQQAGFRKIQNEWWHFEAYRREQAKIKYRLIE